MKTSKRISTRTILIIAGIVVAFGLVAAVLLLGLFLGLASGNKGSNLTAKLSEMVGTVQIKKNVQDQYTPVANDFILTTAMQMQTLADSRVRLDLSTGSIVRIDQQTIFSLASRNNKPNGALSEVQLQAGRLWIVLNGGSLDVVTPAGTASVRGSYMYVSMQANTNSLEVDCLEGACQFKNNAGTVSLTSGQKVISPDPNLLPAIQKMDQSDSQLWLDNVPEASAVVPQVESQFATSTPVPAANFAVDYPYWGAQGESFMQISGTICNGFDRSFQLQGQSSLLQVAGDFTFTPAIQGNGTWTFSGTISGFQMSSTGSYEVTGVPGGAPPSPNAFGTFATQASQNGVPALLMSAGHWQVAVPSSPVAIPPLLDETTTPGLWAIPLLPAQAGVCPGN